MADQFAVEKHFGGPCGPISIFQSTVAARRKFQARVSYCPNTTFQRRIDTPYCSAFKPDAIGPRLSRAMSAACGPLRWPLMNTDAPAGAVSIFTRAVEKNAQARARRAEHRHRAQRSWLFTYSPGNTRGAGSVTGTDSDSVNRCGSTWAVRRNRSLFAVGLFELAINP